MSESSNNTLVELRPVFLDAGLQRFFFPLCTTGTFNTLPSNAPKSLVEAMETINKINDFQALKSVIDDLFAKFKKKELVTVIPSPSYLKRRFGTKTWYLKSGPLTLFGLWFLIETNTSAQDYENNVVKYDRGYFYKSVGLSSEEQTKIIELTQKRQQLQNWVLPYITMKNDETGPLFTIKNGKTELLRIDLGVRKPGGKARDIDVILDLGNTRTAGLLFDHLENKDFSPEMFKQSFKVLRIKPDPMSGDYDALEDVDAGIAQSWIILHELEHQTYRQENDDKEPELLQNEYRNIDVKETTTGGFMGLFAKKTLEVTGEKVIRIPQMFTQISPVLIGDQAERVFNLPYAKALISVGAKVQQSAPKRYYWDDSQESVWWSMLLNEWDQYYDDNPAAATSLPFLQGEMLRFIREDGSRLDLNKELQPTQQPVVYPKEPKYPKQSTLTWYLLRLLENAFSQTNSAFSAGADFIPHRLRKVLITFPSGWTNDEIDHYRARCQEALDIFSHCNLYHGVNSETRLEMVERDKTPDEAVAGQLPFVFSEIIRYPNQTAAKWISLVGKKRSEKDSVRIMNFDIGGGTTDISVVEYTDTNAASNSGVSLNLLKTTLLFKDGQALAGDDLVKRIIENFILGGLIKSKGNMPGKSGTKLKDKLIRNFTSVFSNAKDEAIRARIIRTCLIPMATYCLANAGTDYVQFSAQDAGINRNNWVEFLEFIDMPDNAIPIHQPCFNFNSQDINSLIEELFVGLFRNCAIYAAAYDIDMLIFSGKPSELPYMKLMAQKYIPIDNERIIFAREFKAGQWYPFTDDKGYIKDAKTVTVVGSALYYALSNGFINGWRIESTQNKAERNEWGVIAAMEGPDKRAFMDKTAEVAEVVLLPNTIIARRLNMASSPEPVYKFVCKKPETFGNNLVKVTLKRRFTDDGESLSLDNVVSNDSNATPCDPEAFELKLWPCKNSEGFQFWQEKGIFSLDND